MQIERTVQLWIMWIMSSSNSWYVHGFYKTVVDAKIALREVSGWKHYQLVLVDCYQEYP